MAVPTFVHHISEDGLSLITDGTFGNLDLKTTVSWGTLEEAKRNYELAMVTNEKYQKLEADSKDPHAIGSRNWLKTIYPFGVKVSIGVLRGNNYDSRSICFAGHELYLDIINGRTVLKSLKFKHSPEKAKLFGIGGRRFAMFFQILGKTSRTA